MEKRSFIDIHTHIIPQVDDGAINYLQSLEILELMVAQGVKHVIATPHVNSNATTATWEMQVKNFNILKEKAKDLDIDLYLGAEVKYREYLATEYQKYTIEGTNYILMEFNWNTKEDVHGVVNKLQKAGLKPIIAHVERYTYLRLDDYKKLKAGGVLLQINTGSVLQLERKVWEDNANILLDNKLADIIATDVHNTFNRPANIKKAYEYLKHKLDQEYLEKLFYNNPLKIIKAINS